MLHLPLSKSCQFSFNLRMQRSHQQTLGQGNLGESSFFVLDYNRGLVVYIRSFIGEYINIHTYTNYIFVYKHVEYTSKHGQVEEGGSYCIAQYNFFLKKKL